MSRKFFGEWGAELGDEAFACALAWIVTVADSDSTRRLKPSSSWLDMTRRLSAEQAEQKWRQLNPSIPFIIEVPSLDLPRQVSGFWLIAMLRRAPGVGRVVVKARSQKKAFRGGSGATRGGDVERTGGDASEGTTGGGRKGVRGKPPERAVEQRLEPPPPPAKLDPKVDARVLQARLCPGQAAASDELLKPKATYRLDVQIARPQRGWMAASQPFPFEQLPPSDEGHQLEVVLVAARVLQKAELRTLFLPPKEDSEVCSFELVIPVGLARLDARVAVLYQNRILQTLRIRAPIGERQHADDGLKVELESVLRASLGDLSKTAGFEVALLFNDSNGESGVTAYGGNAPAYVSLQGIDEHVRALRTTLEEITQEPDAFDDPKSEASRELFLTLARSGSGFLTGLSELPGMKAVLGRLGAAGRLQVTSLHPDDPIPLELIYDGPFPDEDAKLCPALLGKRPCDDQCAASEQVVCGSRFWGVRHVIERRLFDEHGATSLQQHGASHGFRAEVGATGPVLSPFRTVLLGTADRAASFNEGSFSQNVQELNALLGAAQGKLVQVRGWKPWAVEVAAHSPQLLLIIAHLEQKLGATVLVIGEQERIAAGQIQDLHVWSSPNPPNPGPIVLLFGCRTAGPQVPYSSFISAFRRAHASVIIGTLSAVVGRHMAPVAKHAVELLLDRSAKARTIGEAMRDLRRELLSRAMPVGLTLVAFGEADWQLG
jgi:hypothetical protein